MFCDSGVEIVTENEEPADVKVESEVVVLGAGSGETSEKVDEALAGVDTVEKSKPVEESEEEVRVYPKGGAPKKMEDPDGGATVTDQKFRGHRTKRVCISLKLCVV
jgi:hypothetical protein